VRRDAYRSTSSPRSFSIVNGRFLVGSEGECEGLWYAIGIGWSSFSMFVVALQFRGIFDAGTQRKHPKFNR